MSSIVDSLEQGGGAAQAQQNNINQFTTSAAPSEAQYFTGMQGANINQSGAQPYSNAQQGLLTQLQAQANGAGPNLANQQLQQGTQANIAAQMAAAAGQRGNQNPGAAEYNLASQAAATRQQAAGQAAMNAGQTQLGAEGALGNLAGQGFNQGAQQAALNQQTNQFNAQSQQNLGNLLSNQWNQAGQLNEAGQANYNQNITALLGQQQQAAQGAISGLTNMASAAGGGLADGGVIDGPEQHLVGEAGTEVIMPTEKDHLANFLQTLHAKASADPEMKKDILAALQASVKTIKKAG